VITYALGFVVGLGVGVMAGLWVGRPALPPEPDSEAALATYQRQWIRDFVRRHPEIVRGGPGTWQL